MNIEMDEERNSTEALKEGSPLSFTRRKPVMSTSGDKIEVEPQPAHRRVREPGGQVTARHVIDCKELEPGSVILPEEPQPPSLPVRSVYEQPALATIYGPNGATRKCHSVDAREICARPDSVWSLTPLEMPEGVQE